MIQFKSLLLHVFSGTSIPKNQAWVQQILTIAESLHARLVISCLESEIQRVQKILSTLKATERDLGVIEVKTLVSEDSHLVVDAAREAGVDLIVMQLDSFLKKVKTRQTSKSTKRKSQFDSGKLLEMSPFPVLLVPQSIRFKQELNVLLLEWKAPMERQEWHLLRSSLSDAQFPVLMVRKGEALGLISSPEKQVLAA